MHECLLHTISGCQQHMSALSTHTSFLVSDEKMFIAYVQVWICTYFAEAFATFPKFPVLFIQEKYDFIYTLNN